MKEIIEITKRMISIVKVGLSHSKDDYEKERYKELGLLVNNLLNHISNDKIINLVNIQDIENDNYPTPKIEVRGLIMKENKILFVKEKEDNLWSIPGGWAEVGFSPLESIKKEMEEETGLITSIQRLLAVFDKKFYSHPPSLNYVYKLCFLCEIEGGRFKENIETDIIRYFSINELPPLSTRRITKEQILKLVDLANDPFLNTYFD